MICMYCGVETRRDDSHMSQEGCNTAMKSEIKALRLKLDQKIKDPEQHEIEPEKEYRGRDWRKETEIWIFQNPEVYSIYVELANKCIAEGRSRIGVNYLAEQVRWEYKFRFHNEYKMCNTLRPYISRKLVQDFPEFKSLFSFRKTKW